eukprot:6399541-Prymnesium_polylepis.1
MQRGLELAVSPVEQIIGERQLGKRRVCLERRADVDRSRCGDVRRVPRAGEAEHAKRRVAPQRVAERFRAGGTQPTAGKVKLLKLRAEDKQRAGA